MRKKSYPLIVLMPLFLLMAAGALPGSNRRRQRQHQSGQPGAFDFYVLALSWSPEFCHSHASKPECTSGQFGLVVHGLWPQWKNGYPENCSSAPGLSDPTRMTDIMPDASLVAHEWTTHGTCAGLDADAYFQLMRRAYVSLKIPSPLNRPKRMFSIPPQELKDAFVAANPRLKAEDLAVSCGNNYLTGVYVCLDKQLQPRACEGLRDCRANVIKVPPVRGPE